MSQLTNYIEKELGKGFSKDAVKAKLLKVGYTKEQIQQSFAAVEGKQDTVVVEPTKSIPKHIAWRKIWTIIAIIGVIVLVSVGLLFVNNLFSDGFSLSSPSCDDAVGEEKDLCYLEYAKENDDVTHCASMGTSGLKAYCEEEGWNRDDCSYATITGAEDACFVQMAIQREDSTYCYRSTNVVECLKKVTLTLNDVKFCWLSEECVAAVALEWKDDSLCETLPRGTEKNCFQKYALGVHDKSYCVKEDDACLAQFS
jgi:hypothetical protein